MLEAWVTEAAACLGRAFDAHSVRVFGSRAHGRPTRRSDLDLFVIADTQLPALERIARALRALPNLPCAVDPIVYTPRELDARSASPFLKHVLATGVVVYERSQAQE